MFVRQVFIRAIWNVQTCIYPLMTKKKQKAKKTDFKAFITDIVRLDWKLIFLLFLIVFISLFVSQNNLPQIQNSGTVFGVKTDLFEKPTILSSPVTFKNPALYPRKSTD